MDIHRNTTHGLTGTIEYHIWEGIKGRCLNANNKDYYNYGERGIKVCLTWQDSFEVFLKDMGLRPSKLHSIDRIDNAKGYSKDNCKWATKKEQSRNKRSNITYMGECAVDASYRLGGCKNLIYERLKRGFTLEDAFTQPIREGLTYNNETLEEGSIRLGGHKTLIQKRLAMGWDLKKAFTTKARRKK